MMSAALDPRDPDDFAVMRDAMADDPWCLAWLLGYAAAAAVSAPSLTGGP